MIEIATTNSSRNSEDGSLNPIPPLGVRHLMLWVTCAALWIAIWNVGESPTAQADLSELTFYEPLTLIDYIQLAMMSIQSGLEIAAALVWLWYRFSRKALERHPGHYLVLNYGLSSIATVLVISAGLDSVWESYPTTAGISIPGEFWFESVVGVLVYVGGVAIACLASQQMRKSESTNHWRGFFIVLAAVGTLGGLLQLWQIYQMQNILRGGTFFTTSVSTVYLGSPYSLLFLLFLAWFLFQDRKKGIQRDWLHWVAVVIVASEIPMFLVSTFLGGVTIAM